MSPPRLLERNEPRGFGGADTGATVGDGLVCDGELAQVVASHLRLQSDRKRKPSASLVSSFDNLEVEADSIVVTDIWYAVMVIYLRRCVDIYIR